MTPEKPQRTAAEKTARAHEADQAPAELVGARRDQAARGTGIPVSKVTTTVHAWTVKAEEGLAEQKDGTPPPVTSVSGDSADARAVTGRLITDLSSVEEKEWNSLSPSPFYSWKYLKAFQDHLGNDLVPCHLLLERGGSIVTAVPGFFQRRANYFSMETLLRGRLPFSIRAPLALHSPLSFSSKVLAPCLPIKEALAAADRALAREAKRGGFGIASYLYVEKGSAQAQILRELGYHPVFVTCTARLELKGNTFEDYLHSLPRATKNIRTNIRRELKQNRDCGVTNSILPPAAADPAAFIALYNQVYAKYNGRPSLLTPGLLRDLLEALGEDGLMITATKDGRLLGYGILVKAGSVWHCFNMGLDQEAVRESAAYFVLAYDYPIALALERCASSLDLRPGHIHLKALRGARVIPLYMYVKHFGGGAQNRLFGAYCRALDAWYRRKYRQKEIAPHSGFEVAL